MCWHESSVSPLGPGELGHGEDSCIPDTPLEDWLALLDEVLAYCETLPPQPAWMAVLDASET